MGKYSHFAEKRKIRPILKPYGIGWQCGYAPVGIEVIFFPLLPRRKAHKKAIAQAGSEAERSEPQTLASRAFLPFMPLKFQKKCFSRARDS